MSSLNVTISRLLSMLRLNLVRVGGSKSTSYTSTCLAACTRLTPPNMSVATPLSSDKKLVLANWPSGGLDLMLSRSLGATKRVILGESCIDTEVPDDSSTSVVTSALAVN